MKQIPSATHEIDPYVREWVKLEPKEFVTDVFIIQNADEGERSSPETE